MLTSYLIKNIYSHFEYNELQKIVREPTLDTILLLNRQVKRNAQSIPTTLGGGQLGYLALVVPEDTYNSIPTSEIFIRPTDPGKFTLQVPSASSNVTVLQYYNHHQAQQDVQPEALHDQQVPLLQI